MNTLHAAFRQSPRMLLFRMKRLLRNNIARKFPETYQKYVDGKVTSLPAFRITGRENVDLAEKVANFYAPVYRAYTEDAAKGSFTFYGHQVDFGTPEAINWNTTISSESDFHLWRMKLGHMGFICPMLIDRKPNQLDAVSRIIDGYKTNTRYDEPGAFSSYLFPYSVSHRILAIISGFILTIRKGCLPKDLEVQIQDFLHWNAGFLFGNIEHELKNNHVERNLAALCLYLDALENVPYALIKSLDRDVREIIEACVLSDGLLVERSAMYQGLTVMALMVFAEAAYLIDGHTSIGQELYGEGHQGMDNHDSS